MRKVIVSEYNGQVIDTLLYLSILEYKAEVIVRILYNKKRIRFK